MSAVHKNYCNIKYNTSANPNYSLYRRDKKNQVLLYSKFLK